jgi:hypothetical protein
MADLKKTVTKKMNGNQMSKNGNMMAKSNGPLPKTKAGQMYKRVNGQYVPYNPIGIEKDSINAILKSKKKTKP